MIVPSDTAFATAMQSAEARWANKVDRFAHTPITITHHPKFALQPTDRFFCIGSCFARNIEEALICRDVEVLSRRIISPHSEHGARTNGIINKFTTSSMLNEVRWALEGRDHISERQFIETADGFLDPQLSPAMKPLTLQRVLERRSYLEKDYFARIADADVLILTLGLTEAWYDTQERAFLNMTPPFYAAKQAPGRFEVHLTDLMQNISALESIYAMVKAARPDIRIVVTVSPVPLDTTFSGRDVLVANAHSKSVLRCAADAFAEAHSDVDYFPSYEFVTSSDRASTFAPDMRHVRDPIVRSVVDRFVKAYLPELGAGEPDFVEALYLEANPDVEDAVRAGNLGSGYEHWRTLGKSEQRALVPAEIPEWIYIVGILDAPTPPAGA